MGPGLGIYLQDLDLGHEAFELVPGQKLVAPTRSSKQVWGPGLGIYLQDLDLGTKIFLNKSLSF
jgi:hypothetical protein